MDDFPKSTDSDDASVSIETRVDIPSETSSETHVSMNGASKRDYERINGYASARLVLDKNLETTLTSNNRDKISLESDVDATRRIKGRESDFNDSMKEAETTVGIEGQNKMFEKTDTVDDDVDDEDKETDEENKHLPIDRGWAWVILLASVLIHFIVVGQLKCFGILFVQYQRRFGSSSSETSIIFTVMNSTYSITALLVLTIGSNVPTRTWMTIGTLIMCIGSALTGLINDVRFAFITVGAAAGLANAFVMPQISTTISEYFVIRRGFANNVMNIGVSLGGIALPPVLTKLFETYGYTGTHILITGLNMQIFVIACLVRPVSFYRKLYRRVLQATTVDDSEEKLKLLGVNETSQKCDENGFDNPVDNRLQKLTNVERSVMCNDEPKALILSEQFSENGFVRRRRFFSESDSARSKPIFTRNSHQHVIAERFASTDFLNTSLMDLTLVRDENINGKAIENDDVDQNETKTCKLAFRKLISKLFDFKLLSNPVFQYYLLVNALLCTGCSLAGAYLPTHAIECGVSDDLAALLVSIPSILDILSKFIFGYLSDKGWCQRSTLISIASFILGIVAMFFHFMTTFETMLIYAVAAGLLQGVYFALFVVVIIDILGMENLKGALGFISLAQGITGGASLPVAGYLRDYSGSYNYTFTFIGCFLMIGAILCYFVPNVQTWHLNKLKQKDKLETGV